MRWFLFLVLLCALASPPVLGEDRALHPFEQKGRLEHDEDAHKLVAEVLSYFGIGSFTWEVLLAPDDKDTAHAMAKFIPAGPRRQIIFNQKFMNQLAVESSRWAQYCVASHEIGHLLRAHLERHAIKLYDAELEADFYCGFVLGKMGASYDHTVGSIGWFSGSPGYPPREERVAQIGHGWTDATGLSAGSERVVLWQSDNTLVAQGITGPDPTPVANNPAPLLAKYDYKNNRDLYGYDIAFTNGRAGIPGLNLEQCVRRCDETAACKAFSFDKWNGWCFLKSDVSTSLLDPPSILGVKAPGELPKVSKGPALLLKLVGKRFRDKPRRITKAVDAESCRSICADDLNCVAFSFVKSLPPEEACFLFDRSEGYYADENAVSGYKRQSAGTIR